MPFTCRGLHRRPANGTGADFRVSRHGKRGHGKPCPTVKSRNSAYNYTHLSWFIVGVGLCSTRKALRDHKALAGEPCSTIRRNTEMQGFLRRPESFARRGLHRRPVNGTGKDFVVCSCGKYRRSQASPILQNHEIVLIITHALSRPIVGVGLCSTRKALRDHTALAGEQCSPLR